jgi:hypothetical protein
MSALGSLVVKLALEYAEYTKGLDKSDQESLKFAQRAQRHFDMAAKAGNDFMNGMVTKAVGAVAAIVTVGAAVDSLNRAIDSMAQLDDLTQKTGSSVENLSRLQQVAGAFGHDFGNVDSALSKLSKGMAAVDDDTNKTNKALRALGVSAKDSAGKLRDPSEVFMEAAKRLATYKDGAAKAALVTDLLGKSGADLLPYMNDVAESVDKFQGVSAEAAANAAQFQDQLGMTRAKFEVLVAQVVSGALPAMNDLLEAFSDTAGEANGLADSKVTDWADDLAVGLARVVDVAQLIPRLLSAVGGSFKVVGADIGLALEVMANANPINAARKLAQGGDPVADLRKALKERNDVLEAANKQWDDLWNKPANELEQATLRRIAERKAAPASDPATATGQQKSGLTYGSKSDSKSDYEALNKALQQRLALAERELVVGRALTASEKELAGIMRGRAEGTVKLTDAEFDKLAAGLAQLDADQRIIAGRENLAALNKQLADDSRKAVQDTISEAERNETLAESIGRTAAETEAAALARLESQLAQRSDLGLTWEEIQALEKLIDAKRRSGAAAVRVEELQAAKKGLDELNAFLDPAKAKGFGDALRAAFGSAGSAAVKLTGVLEDFSQRQAEISKQRGNAANAYLNGLVTEKQYMEDLASLSDMETRSRLSGYGDMASAAAGFFGEQSKGYQALMAVSKVFHAAELAMTLAELVPKGISAVLTQGTGDPYTAFGRMAAMAAIVAGLGVAIGGVGGGGGGNVAKERQAAAGTGSVLGDSKAKSESIANALELVAANSDIELSYTAGMLDALRNIESSISGLGNLLVRSGALTGEVAPDRKGGTEEFGRSTLGVALTGGILGLTLDKLTGGFVGKMTGKVLGSILGGKVTTLDTGLTADRASLGTVLAGGIKAKQYTDIKKDGGWFRSDKTSTTSVTLDAEANAQFTKIIAGLGGSIQEAGKLLGVSGDAFSERLNSFVVDIGKISLKDLKGEDIQKQLEAVFGKLGDDMARFGIGGLEQFQEVGEGYFETLTRIASNYANLDSIMASIGATFGATGMESIAARERLLSLTGGIKELGEKSNAFAENFLTEAERLAPVQKYVSDQMAALGLSHVTTADQYKKVVLDLANSGALATEAGAKQYAALLDLAEAFAKTHEATKAVSRSAQDIAAERASLQDQLDQLTMSSTELLTKQRNALDESNRALFDQVQALGEQARVAGERAGLQDQLDQLTMSSAQLLAKQRAALDESNRALFDQIQALQAHALTIAALEESANAALGGISRAVAAEKERLTNQYNQDVENIRAETQARVEAAQARMEAANNELAAIKSVFQTLENAVQATKLEADAISVERRAAAKAVLVTALASSSAGGGLQSVAGLGDALSELSKPSAKLYGSFEEYARDQVRTGNMISALRDRAGTQVDKAQAAVDAVKDATRTIQQSGDEQLKALQLRHTEAMKKQDDILLQAQLQLDELQGIDNSVLNLGEAVREFAKAIEALKAAKPEVPPVSSAPSTPTDRIEKLYQELLGRKSDQEGLKFWLDAYNNGVTLDSIAKDFVNSEEYKRIHGYALGGDHMGGFRLVGEDGPEIEATGPSRIYSASQTRKLLQGDDGELAVAVEQLSKEVTNLKSTIQGMEKAGDTTAKSTRDMLSLLRRVTQEGTGMITLAAEV